MSALTVLIIYVLASIGAVLVLAAFVASAVYLAVLIILALISKGRRA